MESKNNIKCPNCGTEISVNDILYNQIKEQLNKENENHRSKLDAEYSSKLKKLESEKQAISKEKEEIEDKISKGIKEKLSLEKEKIAKSLKSEIESEYSDTIKKMNDELTEKTEKVKELNKTKAEIERLKRANDEIREVITLEKEAELNERIKTEKERIVKQAEESNAMKIKELEKQLEDQKKLAEEMKRKAEQGSMQLHGEVQELAIQEILVSIFPFDNISEVAKGVKGADVIHRVMNRVGQECGTIIYESKRTKAFNKEWIKKLKDDANIVKADMSILVTEALPDNIEEIGQMDGVWVCSLKSFRSLVLVIRDSLIKVSEAFSSQTNKGEKMEMLYNYLMGNEFKQNISSIIDGFNSLHTGYINEKKAMERIWKEREKQLEKILLNTNHFIGSIKGIASIEIKQLESDNTDKLVE